MRPSASQAVEPLDFELLYDDSESLDSTWHGMQIALLVELAHRAMSDRGRLDYHAAGNQFVYWSVEQARAVARDPVHTRHLRGPDFVFVGGIAKRDRPCWVVWEEGGKVPDVILELLSPTTARLDRGRKKDEYERSLGAPELFHYDPATERLAGWRLVEGRYREMRPNPEERLYSHGLGLWLGTWRGLYQDSDATWVRLFDDRGRMLPTGTEGERAAQEQAKAALEQARAAQEEAKAALEQARSAQEEARAARARETAQAARAAAAEAELARLRSERGP